MFMLGFPLLLIPFAIYNIIAFLMPGVSWTGAVTTVHVVSGADWSMSAGDMLVALGILVLFGEIMKSTRIGIRTVVDHGLSLILFLGMLVEFLLVKQCATATFFLLLVISFIDVLGGFAAIFASVRANRSAAFDLAITLKMQEGRSPVLASVMRAASWPGFPPQSRIIPPLIIGGWLARGRPREAAFQTAAWGGALISTVVKAVVRRPRPLPPQVQVVVAPLGGSSFPSGHVLTYVGFYGFLAYLIAVEIRSPLVRDAGVASLAALLALVGPSRIQQGHHWAGWPICSRSSSSSAGRPRRSPIPAPTVTQRRILVVFNPNAGRKAGLPTNTNDEADLRRALAERHLDAEVFVSSDEAGAVERVRAAVADGYDVVAAAGGDGTVRSVAFELLGTSTALGILPAGTAMNVARSLGIPRHG